MNKEIRVTEYTIITKPTDIWCICPYCEMENKYDFDITFGYEDYDVWSGNAEIEVECKYCDKSFILNGDVEVD